MGNSQIISRLKECPRPPINKHALHYLISPVGAHCSIKENLPISPDDITLSPPYINFNESKIQEITDQVIYQIKEVYTAGILPSDASVASDINQSFKVLLQGVNDAQEYQNNQFMKIIAVYNYAKLYYCDEIEQEFMKKLKLELKETQDQDAKDSFMADMSSIFALEVVKAFMIDTSGVSEKLLNDMEAGLAESDIGESRVLDFNKFWSTQGYLNSQREFLHNLATSENSSDSVRSLAVKLIVLIANARASSEDYLLAYNIIRRYHLEVDISQELSNAIESFSQACGTRSIEFMLRMNNDKLSLTFEQDMPMLNLASHSSITFVDNYAYICNEKVGFF